MELNESQRSRMRGGGPPSKPAPVDAMSWVLATVGRQKSRSNELATRLLDRLLRRYSTFQTFFPDPAGQSAEALAGWMQRIAARLDDPVRLGPELMQLGRTFARRGVRPLHIDAFTESFQQSLAELEGPQWTATTEGAWRTVLAQVALIIRNGMKVD
ncbi:MAG: globin domain-containing protein [Planctomycetota bacterium]